MVNENEHAYSQESNECITLNMEPPRIEVSFFNRCPDL